jgi:proteasome accessory factor B
MNLSRIRRLLQLIHLLQAGRQYNTESLALACSVSRRTVFRDLETLRSAGLPVLYDENVQRYHLPANYLLPAASLSPEEALSLIVLCHDLSAELPAPFFKPLRSAALKLESLLPARLREQVRELGQAVEVRTGPSNKLHGQESVYDLLVNAIAQQRAVRIDYHSLAEQTDLCTRLSPYRLLFSQRSWYVIGRSSVHRGVRTFNVGRILNLVPLNDAYETPRGFSIDRYLRNAWHLIPEPGPDHEVVVRFGPKVAQNVAEVGWHKTQRLQFLPDGSLDYTVTVSGLGEISWWILGYGDQAEVIRPAELREVIAARAARMLARYNGQA